jgi:hypothetical protein
MAQLISFDDPLRSGNRMPCVPGFQFWATRNSAIGRSGLGNQPVFPKPMVFSEGWTIQAIANTAHAANHKTVRVSPFDPLTNGETKTFELTDDGTHTGSNIPVAITNGDTAAQVATALAAAIQAFFSSDFTEAFVAVAIGSTAQLEALDYSLRLYVTTGLAAGGVAPPLVATQQGGVMYGQGLLARAWASFVYTGYGTSASVFGGVGPHLSQQIPLAFYPLGMKGPRAWPGQVVPSVAWIPPREE